MKYLTIIIVIMSIGLSSCKEQKQDNNSETTPLPKLTDEVLETAIIYEANIRQYSQEGTFKEFTKDIPSLKELGVKIIWVMPVYPISLTKRKATGQKFVSEIEDPEERKKYLGSYYAISDYRGVNPEFGTIGDLRQLIKTAHDNNMYVILDWVPNHTGWDHVWIKEHPDFYTKNAHGEITHPLKEDGTSMGWDDVADLNYNNPEMRKAMIADMSYWITEENIDGFRCDVAGMVPVDFWDEAITELRSKKDIFMLAEAWEPELMQGGRLFDMCYGWDNHHLMKAIAKGEKNTHDWDSYINTMNERYEKDDIIMNFIANHDENSWNGTVNESFGNAREIMAVLTYLTPGMPLIYSGQEYDLDHRLKFFEKDQIPKTKGFFYPLFHKLGVLKTEYPALNGGKNAGTYTRIATEANGKVLAFVREKNGQKIYFIGNLSGQPVTSIVELSGTFKDLLKGDEFTLNQQEAMTFEPWQYYVLK